MNRLTTWLTGTKPNWHRICVSKNALLIHHISHKSQWTKPLNESTVSKIHIGTATESCLQRSSFDSVHFLEFYFFFFADRYRMGKCVRYVTCSYWETKTCRDWDIYTWPNDSSTHPWNKIDEHSPVHYLIPYHLVCWALACSKQRLSYVLPKASLMYQRRACYCDRHFSFVSTTGFLSWQAWTA